MLFNMLAPSKISMGEDVCLIKLSSLLVKLVKRVKLVMFVKLVKLVKLYQVQLPNGQIIS